jgi:hypothetical protein
MRLSLAGTSERRLDQESNSVLLGRRTYVLTKSWSYLSLISLAIAKMGWLILSYYWLDVSAGVEALGPM